jgi:hypothetical protein
MPYHHTYLTSQPIAAFVKTHAAHGFEEEVLDDKTSRWFSQVGFDQSKSSTFLVAIAMAVGLG